MKRNLQAGRLGASLLAAILLVAAAIPAASVAQDKAAAIDALLEGYRLRGEFNGSALVAEQGRVILQKGYGWANMEWNIPNGPDTKHRLGSITKQFTAMLILQLAKEEKLELDSPVSNYLDYYRKDTGSKITIHHLLTHTSGLPNYTTRKFMTSDGVRHPFPVQEFVEKHCSGDLEFEPGEKWNYSNSGYFVLGAVIEKITGKAYSEVLREKIYNPAGMDDSGYDRGETVLERRAAGYAKTGNGYNNAPYLDMSVPHAAGALYSTVQDLYRWDQALYGEKLLPKEWKEKLFTPYAETKLPNGRFIGRYAYGWFVRDMKLGEEGPSVKTIGHGGGIFGFNTTIIRFPSEKHLIVILNNTGRVPLDDMGREIAKILYGVN